MSWFVDFFNKVIASFNVFSYSHLKSFSSGHKIIHLLIVSLFAVLLSTLVYYPTLSAFPNNLENSLTEFEIFRFIPEIMANESVRFGDDFLVFDTQNVLDSNSSRYYIDSNFIYYDYGNRRRELSEVFDLHANKTHIISFISFLILALIPSFIVGYYLIVILMFFMIILLVSSICFAISIVLKFKGSFKDFFVSGMYASSFLALALLANALNFGISILLLLVFITYVIMGGLMKKKTSKDGHKNKKNKKKNRKNEDYIELD